MDEREEVWFDDVDDDDVVRERRREQQLARESLLIETLIDTHLSHNLRCIQDTIRFDCILFNLHYHIPIYCGGSRSILH